MKKIFALLLAALMIFSLAACSDNSNAQQWDRKRVSAPKFNVTVQDVEFTTPSGTMYDKLVVSPLTPEQFNEETAVKAIQQLDFVKKWRLVTNYNENALPYLAKDAQRTGYSYRTTYEFHEAAEHTTVAGRSILVHYQYNTDDVIGYESIMVEVFYGEMEPLTQDQIYSVLKIVFGEEYATYLCYSRMQEEERGHAMYEKQTKDSSIVCERAVEDNYGAAFSMHVYNLAGNKVDGYAGDFHPKARGWESFADLMAWDNDTPHDIWNLGKDFLARHYHEDAFLVPYTSEGQTPTAYSYQQKITSATISAFTMEYHIVMPNVDAQNPYLMNISVSTINDIQDVYCDMVVGYMSPNDSSALNNAMKRATEIASEIAGASVTEDDFANQTSYNVNINDIESVIRFSFAINEDTNRIILSYLATNDSTAFETA